MEKKPPINALAKLGQNCPPLCRTGKNPPVIHLFHAGYCARLASHPHYLPCAFSDGGFVRMVSLVLRKKVSGIRYRFRALSKGGYVSQPFGYPHLRSVALAQVSVLFIPPTSPPLKRLKTLAQDYYSCSR